MKNAPIVRLIVAIILIISYYPSAISQVKPAKTPVKAAQIKEVTLKDLPTTQKILDEGISIKAEADDWYMINMDAVAQKGGATPLNVPKMNGWGKIKVEKGGKMYLTDADLNFKMNIPILEKGQTSMVASMVRVTGVSKEDFQMDGNTISRFGLLEKDGGFYLPWILKVKFDALPGQEYLACFETWGFMGKDILPNKNNYADIGGLVGIKSLIPAKTSGKTLDLEKLNPKMVKEGTRFYFHLHIECTNGAQDEQAQKKVKSMLRQRVSKSGSSPYREAVIETIEKAESATKAVYYPNRKQ